MSEIIEKIVFIALLLRIKHGYATTNSWFSRNALQNSNDDHSNAINGFSGCTIRVINFRGFDINQKLLTQPIVLLRYLTFPLNSNLWPYEWKSAEQESAIKWILETKSKNYTKAAHFLNDQEAISEYGVYSKKYIRMTLDDRFSLSCGSRCEANIYLHPPNFSTSPNYYYTYQFFGNVLKDPFWINYAQNYIMENWRIHFWNTIPKYSLLVCHVTNDSSCYQPSDKAKWISAALGDTRLVTTPQTVLIYEILPSGKELYQLCPNCDPCNPFHLQPIRTARFPESTEMLNNHLIDIEASGSPVEVFRSQSFNIHSDPDRGYGRTRKSVLDWIISLWNSDSLEDMPRIADMHRIAIVLPPNSSIYPLEVDSFYDLIQWKTQSAEKCSKLKSVKYHPKLRFIIVPNAEKYVGIVPFPGLIFRRTQLRFVSCHKEQIHWLHQLKGLIEVFNPSVWFVILIYTKAIQQIMKYIIQPSHIQTANNNVISQLVCAALDQSSNLFSNATLRKNTAFYFTAFFIPLSLLYLGNLYKGSNITELTAGAPMIPFNSFTSLIQNKFTILTRPHKLLSAITSAIKKSGLLPANRPDFFRKNAHEAYPIVSELLFEARMGIRIDMWKPLKKFNSEFSAQMRLYLQHSGMIEGLNQSSVEYTYESQLSEKRLISCEKVALILPGHRASRLHAILKAKNKHSYFGKDILTETLEYYSILGHASSRMMLRFRYILQTGIQDWWQKFFAWELLIKTHKQARETQGNQEDSSENGEGGTQVHSFYIIPLVGLLISTIAFLTIEINLFGNILQWLRIIVYFITQISFPRILYCNFTRTGRVHQFNEM